MTDAWKIFTDESTTTENDNDNQTLSRKKWEGLKSFEGLDTLSVRIIVHGFGSSCPHVWIYELRTALMAVVSIFYVYLKFIYCI